MRNMDPRNPSLLLLISQCQIAAFQCSREFHKPVLIVTKRQGQSRR